MPAKWKTLFRPHHFSIFGDAVIVRLADCVGSINTCQKRERESENEKVLRVHKLTLSDAKNGEMGLMRVSDGKTKCVC